jgi:DNA-binding transcriptional MerR regulator
MGTPDEVIPIEAAAKILDVGVDEMHYLTDQGYIKSVALTGVTRKHYHTSDVAALAEARAKRLSLNDVAAMAQKAYAISRANEQKLKNVLHFLGLDVRALGTDEEDVKSFVLQAKDALADVPAKCVEARWVYEWARQIYAVNEGYLRLIAGYIDTEEPWKNFMALLRRMMELAPLNLFGANKELESAYGYLEAAARSLRHAAYFYVRDQYGVRTADKSFDIAEDYTAPILRILFPH